MLPTFAPNPSDAARAQTATGYVDIAFEITHFGTSPPIEVVSSSNASKDARGDLVRLVARSRFRPTEGWGVRASVARRRALLRRGVAPAACGPRLECRVDRDSPDRFATRSVVMARHGMVATSQPLATEIGVATLRRGGSAVDAAIAANAALGLTEPTSCGIGGDLFAIVWDAASERLHGLNASGRSPLSLTLERLLELGLDADPRARPARRSACRAPSTAGASCTHASAGLPLRELLAPSIAYAREGFPVTEVIGARGRPARARCRHSRASPRSSCRTAARRPIGEPFANSGARARLRAHRERGPRRVLRRPDRRRHRRMRARQRRVSRARGSRGASLASGSSRSSTTYRGWQRLRAAAERPGHRRAADAEHPRRFRSRLAEWGSAEHLHLLIEAKKLAFEDRARFYADPEFAAVPVERLVAKDYAAARRALIDPQARRAGADARRRGGRRRRHGLSRDGRRGRQHGLADPEQLHGLRLRRNGRAVRLRAAEPRLAVRARSRSTRMRTRPASGRSTRSSRRSRCATAKRCSRSASWARRCSRRARCRCCRTCSTSAWACRPPATRRACATRARRSRRASRRSRGGGTVHLEPGFDSAAHRRPAGARPPHRGRWATARAFGGYQAIQRDLRTRRLFRRVGVAQRRSRRGLLSRRRRSRRDTDAVLEQ